MCWVQEAGGSSCLLSAHGLYSLNECSHSERPGMGFSKIASNGHRRAACSDPII